MRAYVDESIRLTGGGLYVLAAVLVPLDQVGELRAAMRDCVKPGRLRYHWADDNPDGRAAMAKTLCSLLPDVVAGAVATACGDGDPTYLDLLADGVTLIEQ